MAGYRLTDGKKYCFVPAIMALGALGLAGFALANYPMNVKIINTTHDAIGIFIGLVASVMLIVSLIWSGWRAYKIDETLNGVMIETAKTTSLVFIILLGAAMLTAAFRAFGGEELVKEFLNSLPGGFWTKFIIVMGVIFILGFFLDFIEIAVVVVPIVAPILLADPSANITAVWLGVMIGLNIQTSFLTPPFGFALFYLRGVAPAIVKTVQMYKGVVAFIGLQLIALVIVGMYPPLVNYLPNRISLLSDTAPPPRNPRLQYCIEDYLLVEFTQNKGSFDVAFDNVRKLDASRLSEEWQDKVKESVNEAQKAINTLVEADKAADNVNKAAEDYRPYHVLVRRLQSRVSRVNKEMKEVENIIERYSADDEQRKELEKHYKNLMTDKERLESEIPEEWEDIQKEFRELVKAETKLRRQFQRTAQSAYEPIVELKTILEQNDEFNALDKNVKTLYNLILKEHKQDSLNLAKALNAELSKLVGVADIKSPLAKMQRELKKNGFDKDKIFGFFDDIQTQYQKDKEWRMNAGENMLVGISQYEEEIRDTIGLRNQEKLERSQVLEIAKCLSHHRDLSLNF